VSERGPGKRLFVGVRVAVATANELAACAETVARRANDRGIDIRWVPPASYHVTLKFLGWTRDDAIAAVRDALDDVACGAERFAFRVERLGAFASLDRANVVWAGVTGSGGDPFGALATRIDDAMAALGFPREKRAFHAHVTLGRLKETRAVREVVLPMAEQMFGSTDTEAILLFESETKSSGSVYRELARITFKPAVDRRSGAPERQSAPVELDETDDGWPRDRGQ
jgi:2'-5' RNA ligase